MVNLLKCSNLNVSRLSFQLFVFVMPFSAKCNSPLVPSIFSLGRKYSIINEHEEPQNLYAFSLNSLTAAEQSP